MELEDFKFSVRNEKESRAVQETLFSVGYKWQSGGKEINHTEAKHLFAHSVGIISYGGSRNYFRRKPHKEIKL